jgi:hypothetical protein
MCCEIKRGRYRSREVGGAGRCEAVEAKESQSQGNFEAHEVNTGHRAALSGNAVTLAGGNSGYQHITNVSPSKTSSPLDGKPTSPSGGELRYEHTADDIRRKIGSPLSGYHSHF